MSTFCEHCGKENLDYAYMCSGCGSKIGGVQSSDRLLPQGLVLRNRYKIVELVHSGEMGALYRAIDNNYKRKCEVKEIIPYYRGIYDHEEIQNYFHREAKFLADLKYMNLPDIVDYFMVDNRCYLVMDLVEGENLKDLLVKQGKPGLPQDRIIELAIEILEVIDFFQEQEPPIIYFYIDPVTVKVHKNGYVLLTDFAISRLIEIGGEMGISGGGESRSADFVEKYIRLELFSLASTMYVLLTGSGCEEDNFKKIRTLNPSVTSPFEEVVNKLVNKEFVGRLSSVKGVQSALKQLRCEAVHDNKIFERKSDRVIVSSIPVRVRKSDLIQDKMGQKVWEFWTGGPVLSSPSVIDNHLYFGSFDNYMYCLNPAGKIVWKFKTEGKITSSLCFEKEFVYFGSHDNYLYCLDARSGREIWKFKANHYIQSSPCVYDGFVYVGSADRHFYCLDAQSGQKKWDFKTNSIIDSSPFVFRDRVFFGNRENKIFCLDRRNGRFIWEFRAKSQINGSPLVLGNLVYFNTLCDAFYCVDAKDGKEIWRITLTYAWITMWLDSSPCFLEKNIYFGTTGRKIYCVDGENGKIVWEFNTDGKVASSPCVAGGLLFVGSDDTNLYCLDAIEGQLIWKFRATHIIRSSPCVADGLVYFGSNDGRLYCLYSGITGISAPNSVSRQGFL